VRPWLRAGFGFGLLLLAAQFALIVPEARAWVDDHSWANDVLQDAVYGLAALLVLARALVVRRDRGAWLLMAGGLGSYAMGTVLWVAVIVKLNPPPYPSVADAMWLGYYPFAYAAVVRLLHARHFRISAPTWLDGLIAASCAAAFASVMFLSGFSGGSGWSLVVSLAYPIADIVLSGLLLGGWALSGWRTERVWMLLLAGMGINITANALHMVETTGGTYIPGGWTDALWSVALALIVVAAWQRPRATDDRRPPRALVGMVLPALLACASLGLLLYGSRHSPDLPRATSLLAATAIGAAIVRRRSPTRAGRPAPTTSPSCPTAGCSWRTSTGPCTTATRRRPWPSPSSTSTGSRRSTTASATTSATGCCRWSPPGSPTPSAPTGCWPGWAGTSSACCCPPPPSTGA
jgi:hypothetical protein